MKKKRTTSTGRADSRERRGRKRLAENLGPEGVAAMAALEDFAPELARMVYAFPYGELHGRPGLSPKTRQLVTVVAIAAQGHAHPQLKAHLNGALRAGWTKDELVEVLLQLAAYCGFPVALNGVRALREVMAARKPQNGPGAA